MHEDLPTSLREFSNALSALRLALADAPAMEAMVFEGSQDWDSLLRFKLLPDEAEQDCLVVAMGGGTNTGKSTLFNLLAGADLSPVRSTAAATCRPVLAANPERMRDCLEGRLLSGFTPRRMERTEEPLQHDHAPETLFVTEAETLPPSRVLLDTPDVDSIDLANWDAATRLRAAGDIVLAVLTGEKYQDNRVVAFFREAAASGRIVLPIMNKAHDHNDYEVARQQLQDFCRSTGLPEAPLFAAPHDFELLQKGDAHAIRRLDAPGSLPEYLDSLDSQELKQQVYAATADRFVQQTGGLAERMHAAADTLHAVVDGFESAALRHALRYEPTPGAAVGGLFHQFVQNKRGRVDRAIGGASKVFVKGVGIVGRSVQQALASRALLQPPERDPSEAKVRRLNVNQIEEITTDLIAQYVELVRALPEPAGRMIQPSLDALNAEELKERVVRATEAGGGISEDFREHAERTLELWWHDNWGKRQVIEALDKVLLLAPAGIAGVLSVQTAGVGVPEALIVAGPVFEQFAARVMEYQFGDAMFDFISPWRREQQEAFERALREHLAHPLIEPVQRMLDALEDHPGAQLKRSLEACRAALQTS